MEVGQSGNHGHSVLLDVVWVHNQEVGHAVRLQFWEVVNHVLDL